MAKRRWWHLRAADGPQSQEPSLVPDTEKDRDREYGATGTSNFNGYLLPSEFNNDLKGRAAYDVWEEMRRSDPSVRETVWHLFAPILNAHWGVEAPPDPSEDELEQAEFVRKAFFEWLDQPWAEVMRNVLSYLEMGNAVFETTFKTIEGTLTLDVPSDSESEPPKPPAGPAAEPPAPVSPPTSEKQELPPREFVTWRKFAPRLPRTIYRWNVDEWGDLVSITQLAPKNEPLQNEPQGSRGPDGALPPQSLGISSGQAWKELTIPAQYLLVFTHDKLGDEYSGLSVLRAAYKPWWLKQMIERTMGLSYERYGVGVPVAWIPSDREEDQKLIERIEEMLTELRAGESNFLIFPGARSTTTRAGYDFEIVSPGSTFPKFVEALEYLRGEIAGAMLCRFKELGMTGTGSRNTASIQSEVWYNLLHAIARYISDQFQVAIRRLVDMNYAGVTRYPTLKASGIEARDLLAFAQSIALLTNSEVLLPDTPLRKWVRASIDAPLENEDEAEARLQNNLLQQNVQNRSDLGFGRGPETEPGETARPRAENAKAAEGFDGDRIIAAVLAERRAAAEATPPVELAHANGSKRRKITPVRDDAGNVTSYDIEEE